MLSQCLFICIYVYIYNGSNYNNILKYCIKQLLILQKEQQKKSKLHLISHKHMQNLSRIKGKPALLHQFGLPYNPQLLIAIPTIFDYQDNQTMKKITIFSKYIYHAISHTYKTLQYIKIHISQSCLLKKFLINVWPLFIRKVDPQKFNQHIKQLKDIFNLTVQHVCLMKYYSNKYPQRFPSFCLKHTLQIFTIRQDQLNNQILINIVIGQQCIQTLLNIIKYNIHKQIILSQQNQYIQQQYRPSSMTAIIQKFIKRKNSTMNFLKSIKNQKVIIKYIDQWMKNDGQNQVVHVFRLLKIILVLECLYERIQLEGSKQQPIAKIIHQILQRLLHTFFTPSIKQKIVLLDWILQTKTLQQNEQLKNNLMYFMISCYQLHTKIKTNSNSNHILLQKLQHEQNSMVIKYILKIKNRYYNNWIFRDKVPKSYLKIKLGLIQNSSNNNQQNYNSILNKNGTGTVSITKIQNSLDKQTISISHYHNSNNKSIQFDKLIASIAKYSQNLQLHKIYIIGLVISQQLNKKQIPQQTDTQNNRLSSLQAYHSNYRKLFYQILKCVKQYVEIFMNNVLTWEIMKIMSNFVKCFTTGSIKEVYKTDLHDLEMLANNELNLQNLSHNLLKNPIFFNLLTIYQIECGQNCYNKAISENNKPTTTSNKNNKNLKQKPKLDNENNQKTVFINILQNMITMLAKKPQQIQFLQKIALVNNHRVSNSLYLNLIFYLLIKISKQKQQHQRKSQIKQILIKLFQHYFLKQNPNEKQMSIILILATPHKIFQNWKRCTRRSIMTSCKQLQSIAYDNYEQQKKASYFYWQIFVSTSKYQLNIYAKNFERANCIKQSIYLMQLYNKRTFPPKYTTQQAQTVYNLFSRLQNNLNICKPYIQHKLITPEKKNKLKNHKTTYNKKQCKNNELNWYYRLKYLMNRKSIDNYTTLVYKSLLKICQLEDIQQIDNNLNQIFLCYVYFQVLNNSDYPKLQQNLSKSNQKDICLSIIKCLQHQKIQIYNTASFKNKIRSISTIIYNEKLKFNQIYSLKQQLTNIYPENMSNQQIRAAFILYSKTKQFQKVRLLYRFTKNLPQNQRQELEFYNIQASYRSIMFYSSEQMIKNLHIIIKYIEDQKNPNKINKQSTNPLFQSIKFLFENYQSLSLSQQKLIINCLNRYLKKVYAIKNQSLSKQAAYFILRFILIQSNNAEQLVQNSQTFNLQEYSGNILQSHKWLLITNIGINQKINQFICKVLTKIAEYNPKASSWWLFGLINHCSKPTITSNPQIFVYDTIDRMIEKMGNKIYQQLKIRRYSLEAEFKWLQWLLNAISPDSQINNTKASLKMVSPFSEEITLQRVAKISALGHGKSKPCLIQFKGKKNNNNTPIFMIRKITSNNKSGFRTQSATANFFKDSQLLDQGVTYSIFHLSKYCLLVQYIKHQATLDHLMMNKIESTQLAKVSTIMNAMKNRFSQQRMLSELYDKTNLNVNYQLHKFFFQPGHSVINSWWWKYTNFLKTYAQWCYLGYVIGLGDRHTNNILVTQEGKIIHIDFQYIFDSGKCLQFPQWVPFRLTRGIIHQLSIIQPYGIIYSEFIKTAEKYKQKSRQIWHAESHFSFLKKNNMSSAINKRSSMNNELFQESLKIFQSATSDLFLRDMFIGWASYK